MAVAGVQSTSVIWLGISDKTQDISWFSTVYTSTAIGVMVAPENSSVELTASKIQLSLQEEYDERLAFKSSCHS